MDSNTTTTVTLKVNGDEAKNKINNLLDQLTTMRQRLRQLSSIPVVQLTPSQKKEVKELTRDITQTQKELQRMQSAAQAADHVLSQISTANLKELKTTLRNINRELNSGDVQRGSERWNQLATKAREIKTEIEKVNKEFKTTKELDKAKNDDKSWVQKFGEKWSGFVVTIGGIKDTIDKVTSTAMDYYQAYADMAEHMNNVKKYTGLTDEQVKELNEDFKRIDTRTAREQLNDLAGDAGRLGIQSKQEVLDFVEAADQINVALGEDLGEDAVKNIGKLAQMFGDADTMGLKQAMLSTGSIINELAQSSSASEGYLMEFTARLAGVGKQAGMTQAQVMAFGSVLDQNMVNVEKGATALQNVITALYANPAKMAKVAGLDIKEFTQLLQTDGNAAVLKFVQQLASLGKIDALAPVLKEMNMSGAGVTQTLTTLAANIDSLRTTQEQATQAFKDGTSVTNEFNTANNTVQASLEKYQKALKEVRVELGEKLAPVVSQAITLTTGALQIFKTVIGFVSSHITTIATLTAGIALYTLAVKASIIQDKLKVLWTNTLGASLKSLYATLVANPWGLVIIAITTFISYMRESAEATQKARKEQDLLNQTQIEATNNARTEREEVEKLFAIARDETKTKAERLQAIKRLNDISPEYFGNLRLETINTDKAAAAVRRYVSALILKKKIEAAQNRIEKIEDEKADLPQKAQGGVWDKVKRSVAYTATAFDHLVGQPVFGGSWSMEQLNKPQKVYNNLLQNANNQQKQLRNNINTWTEELVKLESEVSEKTNNSGTDYQSNATNGKSGGSGNDKRLKQIREANAKLDEQQRKEEAQAAVAFQTGQIKTYQQYQEQLIDIDNKYIDRRLALYKKGDSEIATLQKQRAENDKNDLRLKQEFSLQTIDNETQEQINALKQRYYAGEMQEEQYQTELDRIQEQRLQRRLKWLKDPANAADPKAIYDTEKQLEDLQNAQSLTRLEKLFQKAQAMREEYTQQSLDDQEVAELELLDQLTEAFKWSEEERAKYAEEIHKKYEKKREEENPDDSEGKKDDTPLLTGSTDAMSAAVINFGRIFEQLQQRIKDGTATWQDYAAAGIAAVSMVTATMSSASQLIQANQQLEEARITKRYDAEIKAAGNNTKKTKKLEEQKQAELAKVKTKYNKKAMKIELAQATAQMAMNAVIAYGEALKIGGLAGLILAPIAAAAALAAGAIQIASIKKQHAAEEEGFYTGGFTGGRNYTQAAGIVHQGEFVANHQAVNNPALLPVLQLIDQAQRTNRVAQLTPADVSRAIIAPQTTAAATRQTATATTQAAATTPQTLQIINTATDRQTDTLERLNAQLDRGITATVVIDGPNGLDHQYKRYQQLNNV